MSLKCFAQNTKQITHVSGAGMTYLPRSKLHMGSLDKKATGFLHRILENSWK